MAGRYPAGRCLRRTRLPRVPVHFGVDGIEEADELLMAMALHVLPISVSSIALDCCSMPSTTWRLNPLSRQPCSRGW